MFGPLTIDEGPSLSMTDGRGVTHFMLLCETAMLSSIMWLKCPPKIQPWMNLIKLVTCKLEYIFSCLAHEQGNRMVAQVMSPHHSDHKDTSLFSTVKWLISSFERKSHSEEHKQLQINISELAAAMAGRIPLRQVVREQMIANSDQFLQIDK